MNERELGYALSITRVHNARRARSSSLNLEPTAALRTVFSISVPEPAKRPVSGSVFYFSSFGLRAPLKQEQGEAGHDGHVGYVEDAGP